MGGYFSSEPQLDIHDDSETEDQWMEQLHNQSLDNAKRLRNPLVTILTEILKEKGKLDENLVKENNAILKEFLETFIAVMKECDPMFKLLHQKIYFTGSYYSDLRVSTPDEYDLNVNLKFPFKPSLVSIQYHSQVPSYAKYSTTDDGKIKEHNLTKFFKDGYLIPENVRKWLQSVIDKALKVYKCPRNVKYIKTSGGGPARTIILVKHVRGQIDIDLVPAIECCMNLKPPGIDGRVYEKVKNNLQCFLIPKPYQPTKQAPVNENERARLWRTHYPNAEQTLIHDVGCVKPVIKLLKLLRDKENWKILASYYLKTIVMWIVLENSSSDHWKNDRLGERFIEALKILAQNVKDRKIRYFFSSRYNLLEKLTDAQADNIHNRLRAIIRDIEKNPENLWNIFGCRKTFSLP